MLENSILWVKVEYPDGSEGIFRGTTSSEIIRAVTGTLPKRDVFNEDGSCLRDNYVFNVKTRTIVNLEDLVFHIFEEKPEFNRRVDKFANSFI